LNNKKNKLNWNRLIWKYNQFIRYQALTINIIKYRIYKKAKK